MKMSKFSLLLHFHSLIYNFHREKKKQVPIEGKLSQVKYAILFHVSFCKRYCSKYNKSYMITASHMMLLKRTTLNKLLHNIGIILAHQ